MTDYNKVLQTEIDKVQGYVDGKKEAIMTTELQLDKDKSQLAELENKLNDLLAEKKDLQEFNEWKNSVKKALKTTKANATTGSIKGSKVTAGEPIEFSEAKVVGLDSKE